MSCADDSSSSENVKKKKGTKLPEPHDSELSHSSSEKDSGFSDTSSEWKLPNTDDHSHDADDPEPKEPEEEPPRRIRNRRNLTVAPAASAVPSFYILSDMVQPRMVQRNASLPWSRARPSVSGSNPVLLLQSANILPAPPHPATATQGNTTTTTAAALGKNPTSTASLSRNATTATSLGNNTTATLGINASAALGKNAAATTALGKNTIAALGKSATATLGKNANVSKKIFPRIAPYPRKKPPDKATLATDVNQRKRVCTERSLSLALRDPPAASAPLSAPPSDPPSAPPPSVSSVTDSNSPGVLNTRQRRFLNTVQVLRRSGLWDATLKTRELLRQSNTTRREVAQLRQHTELLCHAASDVFPNADVHREAWLSLHATMAQSANYPGLRDATALTIPPPPDATALTIPPPPDATALTIPPPPDATALTIPPPPDPTALTIPPLPDPTALTIPPSPRDANTVTAQDDKEESSSDPSLHETAALTISPSTDGSVVKGTATIKGTASIKGASDGGDCAAGSDAELPAQMEPLWDKGMTPDERTNGADSQEQH